MFTQVYFRAEEILGFLSGFPESGPCSGEPQAESGEPGRGNNETRSSEVDSEEPES